MALIAGAAAAKIAKKIGAELVQSGVKNAGKVLEERIGYDFLGLLIKIIIFYGIAFGIQKVHQIVSGSSTFIIDLLNFFGAGVPQNEPEFFSKLFSDEGFNGISYWQIVNFVVIGLVLFEAFMYVETQKRLGGSPSPFALATFGLIVFLLTSFTLPDMLKKLKGRFSDQTLAANQ